MNIERLLVLQRSNIVCVLMLLVVIGYYISLSRYQVTKKRFLLLGIVNLVLCIFAGLELVSANSDGFSWFTDEILRKGYVVSIMVYAIVFLDYFVSLYVGWHRRTGIVGGLGLIALIIACIMLFTPLDAIEGDSSNYIGGKAVKACFAFCFLLLVTGLIVVVINRKKQRRGMTVAIVGYSLFSMFFMIVQVVYPEFLFEDCIISILTLGLFVSVENPVLNAQLQSFIDLNTGVSNKNGYENYLVEIRRVIKEEEPGQIGCMVFDLNNLKYVNDTFGHQEGDRMIAMAAKIIMEQSTGKVFRTGGDEFVVFERKTTAKALKSCIEEIQGKCLGLKDSFDGAFSLSAGFASKKAGESVDDMIKRADKNMYEEKARMKASQDPKFDLRKR